MRLYRLPKEGKITAFNPSDHAIAADRAQTEEIDFILTRFVPAGSYLELNMDDFQDLTLDWPVVWENE